MRRDVVDKLGGGGSFLAVPLPQNSCEIDSERKAPELQLRKANTIGVLSHHRKCEMKSPHLADFSWDFVEFCSNLSRILADFYNWF